MYIHTFTCFCESRRRFSLFSPLNIYISLFYLCLPDLSLLPACCRVFRGCRVSSGVSPSASPSPWLVPSCLLCVHPVGRALEALRRKTVCQCGQMHRVYTPGLVSSCLCAAVCSVARSVAAVCRLVCVSCCRVSSGGNNSLYASISRAAAMRCSVCNVMLLLSICIRTFCRVSPKRLDSSTTPTPAAFMCSRI